MKQHRRDMLMTLGVSLSIAIIFIITAALEYNRSVESDKRKAGDLLLLTKANIERIITSRIIGTRGLIAFIQTQEDITQEDYETYAQGLYEFDDGVVRNMALIKDTTITHVYPIQGNEAAIGRNLAVIEGQKETVLAVKSTGKMRLTAPVKLVQGGSGIIVRIPISKKSDSGVTDYWGQMSLVFDYDQTLTISGLSRFGETYSIELSDQIPETGEKKIIWSNTDSLPSDSIAETIDLYQAHWMLKLVPKAGWHGTTPTFWSILILGGFASLAAGFGMNRLLAAKSELELRVKERTEALIRTNEYLEQNMGELQESQAELTELNQDLQDSLENLKETQEQLIVSEKLAALGELVAGVAHEINTPLGIGVTLSSYITKLHHTLKEQFENQTLNRSDLKEYLHSSEEALTLLNTNLERASSLVTSFKQVAVDQASQEKRTFKIRESVLDVLKSLQPKLKNTPYTLELDCDEELTVVGYPGALSQIITNFVVNSLIHGFPNRDSGHIHISFSRKGTAIVLMYDDDGAGIPEENLGKVFNPFFSTRKDTGSTGLGLHIVHNIVTQTLAGTISLTSGTNKGVHFKITFEDKL